MKLLQCSLTPGLGFSEMLGLLDSSEAELVLAFGLRSRLTHPAAFASLREKFPNARIVLVSTAGNFSDSIMDDEVIVCTAIRFEKASMTFAMEQLESGADLAECARRLVRKLVAPDLRHVLVFSDGSIVNGSVLGEAFNNALPPGVSLSGGLAGDGTDFIQTLVGLDAAPAPGVIVAIGLCGSSLRFGFGSAGGWSPFGPKRTVTASLGNVLQELDGKLALELYKTYLGEDADDLPASALRFPLYVVSTGETNPVVRTILSIDEKERTMTFAGDIPMNSTVQLMRATCEDLVEGAEKAARQALQEAELLLCVSCVGRRIVLGHRVEAELEGIREIFGPKPIMAGFYSYGELSPSGPQHQCQLHNQTMTITSIAEILT
jgi:hypothetical protein